MDIETKFSEMKDWYAGLYSQIMSSSEFIPLREFFKADIHSLDSYTSWRSSFTGLLDRCLSSDPHRDLAIRAINEFTTKRLQVPSAPHIRHPQIKSMADQIRELGHLTLPPFPADQVREMKSYFESKPVLSPDRSELLPLKGATHGNVAEYSARTVVECPYLLETASNPTLLSIVEEYLGAPPTVIIATGWWSFAGREIPKEAQLFHFDYADFRFINLFIYLTDVDMETGPHVYMEGTNSMSQILKFVNGRFDADQIQKFCGWYFQQLRKSDDEVRYYIPKEPKYFTGPAGTMFLADTRGLHKGLLPKKSDRLLAQFTYALSPAIQTPLDLVDLKYATIPNRLQDRPFNYTYRLLVDTPRYQ